MHEANENQSIDSLLLFFFLPTNQIIIFDDTPIYAATSQFYLTISSVADVSWTCKRPASVVDAHRCVSFIAHGKCTSHLPTHHPQITTQITLGDTRAQSSSSLEKLSSLSSLARVLGGALGASPVWLPISGMAPGRCSPAPPAGGAGASGVLHVHEIHSNHTCHVATYSRKLGSRPAVCIFIRTAPSGTPTLSILKKGANRGSLRTVITGGGGGALASATGAGGAAMPGGGGGGGGAPEARGGAGGGGTPPGAGAARVAGAAAGAAVGAAEVAWTARTCCSAASETTVLDT